MCGKAPAFSYTRLNSKASRLGCACRKAVQAFRTSSGAAAAASYSDFFTPSHAGGAEPHGRQDSGQHGSNVYVCGGPLGDHDAVSPSGLRLVKSLIGGAEDLGGGESMLGKGSNTGGNRDAPERAAAVLYL
jgi:hypothetical protein